MFPSFRKKESAVEFLEGQGNFPRYADWLRDHNDRSTFQNRGDGHTRYFVELNGFLTNHPGGVVAIDQDITQQVLEVLSAKNNFGLAVLQPNRSISFKHKRISSLECANASLIELESCIVTRLVVSQQFNQQIRLKECEIKTIAFVGHTERLEILGGKIHRFEFPQPGAEIRGPVSIRRVSLPTEFLQVQPLRTLRAQLMRIHNTDAPSLVRAAELRIARPG